MDLPRKGKRYEAYFYGHDAGDWVLSPTVLFGFRNHGYDWEAISSLAINNNWRNLSVEGATEHHQGFRKALGEMAAEYPEIGDFLISFDGPYKPVRDLLGAQAATSLADLALFHGTSAWAWDKICVEGLQPRATTQLASAYGSASSAAEGRSDAVYLTTQPGMSHFAAFDAARAHHSEPLVLAVIDLDPRYFVADEDSGESDPLRSIERLGSAAYVRPIAPDHIMVYEIWEPEARIWRKP